jgi:signal transduction histidine kinase
MADVIDAALAALRDRIEKANVEVVRESDAAGTMRGDPEQLRRVLINLLSNALDALQDGAPTQPRIELAVGENLAATEVWVRMRDNGPGIPPERLAQLFEPFRTSKTGGTGLGLAISKKIVEAHGGRIDVESSPGAGTEFVLIFPKDG